MRWLKKKITSQNESNISISLQWLERPKRLAPASTKPCLCLTFFSFQLTWIKRKRDYIAKLTSELSVSGTDYRRGSGNQRNTCARHSLSLEHVNCIQLSTNLFIKNVTNNNAGSVMCLSFRTAYYTLACYSLLKHMGHVFYLVICMSQNFFTSESYPMHCRGIEFV